MRSKKDSRLAVVGIGQELRGDDAAGLEVVRRLQALRAGLDASQPAARRALAKDNVLILEAGPAPENFTGPLRRFNPEVVVLVDAAQMDTLPGSVLYLDWHDTAGYTGSSHTLPLSTVAEYLEKEIGCKVWLLGIQPEGNEYGARMSEATARGVHLAVENLKSFLEL